MITVIRRTDFGKYAIFEAVDIFKRKGLRLTEMT